MLVFESDLGTSLLFFGLFVAMLYVATERTSWIVIGLVLFCGGAYVAYLVFGHVQARVLLWLRHLRHDAPPGSDQLGQGLYGHGRRAACSAPAWAAAAPTSPTSPSPTSSSRASARSSA